MQGGDLDNSPGPPMIFVIWEGLIVRAGPRYTEKRFARRITWRRYTAAVDLLEYNEEAVSALWNLWTTDQQVGIVTYLPGELVPAIRRDLEHQSIPHARFICTSEHLMARSIVQRTDVARVYDADTDRALMYGYKGRIIRPEQARIMETCQ